MALTPADRSPAVDALLSAVTDDLGAAGNGLEFVYRALDRIKETLGADDLIVVVDTPGLGRQCFRAGRLPLDTTWSREVFRAGSEGLHATPVAVDTGLSDGFVNLCTLALRLDVAYHDSRHDALTGVLNRRAFDDLLSSACAQSRRYGWRFSLAVIDLNHFKRVNDRLGHHTGDAVLRAIGEELRSRLRAGDAAARLGGDEFALLLPDSGRDVLARLQSRLDAALDVALPDVAIGISIGLACAPDDGTDPAELLRLADDRLYEHKRVGAVAR